MLSYGNLVWIWAVRCFGITHAPLSRPIMGLDGPAVPRICSAPPSSTKASQWVKEAALPPSELELQIFFLRSAAPVLVPDGRVPTVGASTRTHDVQVQLPLRWPTSSGWQGGFGADRCGFSAEGALRSYRRPEPLSSQALRTLGGRANAMRVSAVSLHSAFNLSRHLLPRYLTIT